MDINRSISLSEFAYNVWSVSCSITSQIFVPHTGKEENDDRAAYYGGRVTPQRKEFISSEYVEGQTEYEYEDLEDYLIYPDVNSLYPAVCDKFTYAIGHWKYLKPEEIFLMDILNILNGTTPDVDINPPNHSKLIPRMCCKVSVVCPKNIITAFLVERLPCGKLVHTLNDKVGQWYWGNEIQEAAIIGYRVVEVLEVKLYEFNAHVFNKFVQKCWQGRIDNPKSKVDKGSNSRNRAFKDTLNKLTGKFGQKSHLTNTTIYNSSANYPDKVCALIV